ncbi:hypothetical protein [Flavobacterium sp. HNIBRBA15423]|uniref:hypothetical protein n=1 Tax=Flavobacterium sp. HNIBRBA15423 TaxID=3458683 RepID=UPI0040441343
MKNIILLFSLFFCAFSVFEYKDFKVEWVENLVGDFSFSKENSLQCDAWCYEYAGVSEIEAKRLKNKTIQCYTFTNIATHSTLNFDIVGDVISNARIELISIASKKSTYFCSEGIMKIDKQAMKRGILKAEFDMKFDHPENPKKLMFWKGKIYTKIK